MLASACTHITEFGDRLAGLLPSQGQHQISAWRDASVWEGCWGEEARNSDHQRPWLQLQRARLLREAPKQKKPQDGERNWVPPGGSSPRFQAEMETREQNWSWRSRAEPAEPWKHNKRTRPSLRRPQRSLSVHSLPGAETNSTGCLEVPSKLALTKTKLSTNISHPNSQNKIQMGP